MKTLNQWILLGGMTAALALGTGTASARPQDGGTPDMQEFQKQMQERIMGYFRDQLVVTNDAEWRVLEPRLSKVMRMRMESMFAMGPGMMRGMGGGGGGGGGGQRMGQMRGFANLIQATPEADALQKAVEADAPAAEIRAKLQRYRDARKKKSAELAAAQKELRDLLSLRQEAVLVSMSMLD